MPLEDLLDLYRGSLIDPATAMNDPTSILASSLTPRDTYLPVSFGEGFGTYYVDPTLQDLTLYRLEDLSTSPTWTGMPALSQGEIFGAVNRANLEDVSRPTASATGGAVAPQATATGGGGLGSLGLTFANIPPAGDTAMIPEVAPESRPSLPALPPTPEARLPGVTPFQPFTEAPAEMAPRAEMAATGLERLLAPDPFAESKRRLRGVR